MSHYEVGFIGAGNMGGALAAAVCRSVDPDKVAVTDVDAAKAQALADKLGCHRADTAAVAAESRFLFLGVKPQAMGTMLEEISPILKGRADPFVLVTMAAGLTVAQIGTMAGVDCPVIRIMPNTPVGVGEGMILYAPNDRVSEEVLAEFRAVLSAAGVLDRLPEELIDAGTVISGCSPAFFCQFAEALAEGGMACGLPRDKAVLYAAQTMKGTAALILQGGDPAALRQAVCSPNGSTIEGVLAMERAGLGEVVGRGVAASFRRTVELGKK